MSAAVPQNDPPNLTRHGARNLVLGKARAQIGQIPYAVTIHVGRHVIIADEPESLGGRDAGPPPFGILTAALGACTMATLKMYAVRKGWPLASLEVELRYLRSHPDGVDTIGRVLTIEGLDHKQQAKLADVAERTPVTLALKRGMAIETRLAKRKA